MRPVTVATEAHDVCDETLTCRVVAITSNEPVNGTGDGDTAPDWSIDGPATVQLRAERAGGGKGSIYTITVECRDDTGGNAAQKTVQVSVPR